MPNSDYPKNYFIIFFREVGVDLVLIWSDYDHWMMSYDDLNISIIQKLGLKIEGHVLQSEGIR